MSHSKSKPIRVVVVDDSPTASELLVTLLQSAGDIEVVGVGHSSDDAVRLARQARPNVVALDINMPRQGGVEATRRIMDEVPTPVVLLTGALTRKDVSLSTEALRAGAMTILGKPSLADPQMCEHVVQIIRIMSEVPIAGR